MSQPVHCQLSFAPPEQPVIATRRTAISTNGLENFFSLLKRGLHGTYISVEPKHLGAYVDEQVYRFNAREKDDGGRFLEILGQTQGRRLTYEELTEKAS